MNEHTVYGEDGTSHKWPANTKGCASLHKDEMRTSRSTQGRGQRKVNSIQQKVKRLPEEKGSPPPREGSTHYPLDICDRRQITVYIHNVHVWHTRLGRRVGDGEGVIGRCMPSFVGDTTQRSIQTSIRLYEWHLYIVSYAGYFITFQNLLTKPVSVLYIIIRILKYRYMI